MEADTNAVNPAAGPDTASCDPLTKDTSIPPIIPDNKPEYKVPRMQARSLNKVVATRNTDNPAGKSCLSQIMRYFSVPHYFVIR